MTRHPPGFITISGTVVSSAKSEQEGDIYLFPCGGESGASTRHGEHSRYGRYCAHIFDGHEWREFRLDWLISDLEYETADKRPELERRIREKVTSWKGLQATYHGSGFFTIYGREIKRPH